jgi:hypothetical protein
MARGTWTHLSEGAVPTKIAEYNGVDILIAEKDYLPPHLHLKCASREAMVSIATGHRLSGSLPPGKMRAVQRWLVSRREQVAYVWREVRDHRFPEGMID